MQQQQVNVFQTRTKFKNKSPATNVFITFFFRLLNLPCNHQLSVYFQFIFFSFISTSFALFRLFSVNVLLWFFGHNRAMLQHCLSAPNAHCCRHTQTVHGAQRHRRAFFTRWSNMDCTNVKMPFYFLFHYRHSATQTTTATTHNTISACCCETICTNATINHTQMSILCAE